MKVMYKVVIVSVFFCNLLTEKAEKEVKKEIVVGTAVDKKVTVNAIPEKKEKKVKQPDLKTVNKIVCVVYTDTDPIIITQLDVERKSLDGRVRTQDEIILE